ncbi:PH domain-containing protein [Patescibacteria group bacterium]|nr:PH domain-containing protein [Patescibacteria group bacterium]MBU1673526.1 PH domain-containing protein [Patescibacteria group bacterium]MBU1963710.1 PH domain-containing protein [Patescibacteria group bacterium]
MTLIKEYFYKNHLLPDEKVLFITEMTFLTRLPFHIFFLIIFMAIGYLIGHWLTGQWLFNTLQIIIISVVPLLLFGGYLIIWRMLLVRRGLILTDKRILHFDNDLFSRHIQSVPYNKITEFDLSENFMGSFFGFGNVTISVYEMNKDIHFNHFMHVGKIEKILTQELDKSSPFNQQ